MPKLPPDEIEEIIEEETILDSIYDLKNMT